MTSIDNTNINFGTIARIHLARDGYNRAFKARNEALVQFYSVYLDAKSNTAARSAIEAEFERLPNHKKSHAISTKIAYIAFSSEKRRVSEVHKILVAAEKADVTVEGMMKWLILNARAVKRGGSSLPRASKLPHMHRVAKSIHANAANKVVLDKAPYPAACEPEDYLIQVCQKLPDGKFVSVWLHAKSAGDLEYIRPVAAQPSKPGAYEDLVAEAAGFREAA